MLLWAVFTALPPYRPTAAHAQETSLTVYSDGRLVVRRTIPGTVARGASTLMADLGVREIELGSIVSLDTGVQVKGLRLFGGVGAEASLRRMVGTEMLFRAGTESETRYVRGTVLSVDPPAVRVDGNVMYGWPGTPVFPDSVVQLGPRYELALESARGASTLRLLYMSNGLSWSASYAVLLPRGGAGQASVTGVAQLDNGAALSLAGAQVQLLAGEVRRAAPPRPTMARAFALSEVRVTSGEPDEESVGGTHVYALPGTIDFVPGETRTIALFPRASAAVDRELVLRSNTYGMMQQWPDAQRDQHPEVTYRVRRPAASPFGQVPMPAGVMRVFEPDSAGRPQLVGEVTIPHTPAGRDVRATTGTAFDVTAVRTQTAFLPNGQRESTGAYRVELQNAGAAAAIVLVTDMCPGRCEIISSSVPGETPSVNTISFQVSVPARGSATLDYRVRARW